ncbi:uncharacterized protein LOC143861220 [Tasmannia lanceolata]|uniref:uncharacterized protein LOC143861220 n=1 Tax=Tasmannia lanceolata TaxID=3420 RepID=UPI00406379CA
MFTLFLHFGYNKNDPVSEEGVIQFLNFAFAHGAHEGKIFCPCTKCGNVRRADKEEAMEHLLWNGMLMGYTRWIYHQEGPSRAMNPNAHRVPDDPIIQDEMHEVLHDIYPRTSHDDDNGPAGEEDDPTDASTDKPDADAEKFFKLLQDVEHELYPGSKFTKLSLVVRLFHIKCLNGWSNKSFIMLLELLKEALPEGAVLPNSFYETKKIVRDLGLHYDKIDACPNDCMLFWKEASNEETCRICGASKWKTTEGHLEDHGTHSSSRDSKVPAKILRHFPLKPRLQRLYMSTKTTSFMTWHNHNRTKDDILRHPADSTAWQTLDLG